jgi:hypothetical protein
MAPVVSLCDVIIGQYSEWLVTFLFLGFLSGPTELVSYCLLILQSKSKGKVVPVLN